MYLLKKYKKIITAIVLYGSLTAFSLYADRRMLLDPQTRQALSAAAMDVEDVTVNILQGGSRYPGIASQTVKQELNAGRIRLLRALCNRVIAQILPVIQTPLANREHEALRRDLLVTIETIQNSANETDLDSLEMQIVALNDRVNALEPYL